MSLVISVIELIKSVCESCENARWNKRTSSRVRTCVKAFEDVLKRMRDTGSSVAIDADEKGVTAADVGVFAKEALVVGVKNYASSPLRNTLNDAEDVAAKLKGMGFRVELSLDPTLKDFDKAQDTFESRLGPGVLALFYFSGHGSEYQGDNYMCMKETPDNVDERRLERTSIQLGKLLEGIRNRGAAFTVVILDACRSVRVTRGTRDASSFGLAEFEPRVDPLRNGGTVIAYATAPRETASDGTGEPGGRNGFYTHHLLKYLAEEKPVRDMLEEVQLEIQEITGFKQKP